MRLNNGDSSASDSNESSDCWNTVAVLSLWLEADWVLGSRGRVESLRSEHCNGNEESRQANECEIERVEAHGFPPTGCAALPTRRTSERRRLVDPYTST